MLNLSVSLAAAIADTQARVRLGYPWWLRPWLARDVAAITLGRRIFVSPSFAERAPAQLERLLRHELAHVRQVNRLGVLVFLWRYASEFVRHYLRLRSLDRAYLAISFEIEANEAERDETQTAL